MAITYGNVYAAQIAMGADLTMQLKPLKKRRAIRGLR